MSIRTVLPVVSLSMLVACGGSNPPAETPPSEPSKAAAEMPSQPAAEQPDDTGDKSAAATKTEEKQEEPKPAPLPKLDKPASASTIAGKSISEVDSLAVQAEAKKLGWVKDGAAVGGGTIGQYEQFRFDIEKGKLKGYIEVVRPASNPTAASGMSIVPPGELVSQREKEGAAVHHDPGSDVLVVVFVEGKPADSKKLLGQLVKAAKAAAKTEKKAEKKEDQAEKKEEKKPEPPKTAPPKAPPKVDPAKK